ncbi:MAG: phosphatase PAP2 family protein [Clostridia bacterium]|nr:phosphatase PAP2 family protein [Clostridia bacterium]
MFAFELQFLKWLESIRTGFFTTLFEGITILGEETLVILFVVALWFAVDSRLAQKVFFVTICSTGLNGIVKNLAKVPRPFDKGVLPVRKETATGFSFPSGHTQSFSTWSTLFAIQYKKKWLTALVAVFIPLVAFSRLYLGVHYPTDVIVGAALGVGMAFLGDYLFERVKDVKKLYLAVLLIFAPFIVYFLIVAHERFAGFFKAFGMLGGLTLIAFLQEKSKPLSYDVPWWKKLLRIVIGVALAFALKEGLKIFETGGVHVDLVLDTLRYFVVVFAVGYLCPLLFQKIKL